MTHPPHEPWNQPAAQPWQQPTQPAWGQPPAPPSSPRPSAGGAGIALLVLGLLTAALGLVGAFLPSYRYGPDDDYSYGPLFQQVAGEDPVFLFVGLVLLAAVVLVVVGALLVVGRHPSAGVPLAVFGFGIVAEYGLQGVLGLVQAGVDDTFSSDPAVGGVLLMLAAPTALAGLVVSILVLRRVRSRG